MIRTAPMPDGKLLRVVCVNIPDSQGFWDAVTTGVTTGLVVLMGLAVVTTVLWLVNRG